MHWYLTREFEVFLTTLAKMFWKNVQSTLHALRTARALTQVVAGLS